MSMDFPRFPRREGPWSPRVAVAAAVLAGAVSLAGGCAAAAPEIALPGAPDLPAELRRKLREAYQSRGPDYVPRTEHRGEDGTPRFFNRLLLESSPYLLQHAHNPVNWYPWGEEAFAAAAALDRPILLSVGYSTCHWCHVMERESFEDLEIAEYLNANYVAIRVDREERPDVDAVYMSAVQMLTGRGGWPMTAWLSPDARPYFGGTYFPPRDGDRGSRTGFLTLLRELKADYDERPGEVAARALQITRRIQASMSARGGGDLPGARSLDEALRRYEAGFDSVHGGMQHAPKFPSSLSVRLLLSQHRRTGDPELLDMAALTLTRMARGGIHDQVGGGFHRYATDARWLVPHFEKMLYDNAQLAVAYLEGWQATGNEEFSRVAREILAYVAREMTSPEGGFYSATDADSPTPKGEQEEGRFFTWTPAEIEEVLGPHPARHVCTYYGVTQGGNFEGRNVLHVPREPENVAELLGVSREELRATIDSARTALYRARLDRPPPLKDEKVLTAWNGLMISAMARGGFVLDDAEWLRRARAAAEFVLASLRRDGRLLRSYKDGAARHDAYLDDYAFLIAGLLDLYEADTDPRWLREAIALQRVLDERYRDGDHGGYHMVGDDHETLLAREKPWHDGAEPSGNSISLMNLLRLHELTSDDLYRRSAEELLRAFGPRLAESPTAAAEMLLGLDFWLDEVREIVIVTPGAASQAGEFLDVLRRTYLPNRVLALVAEASDSRAHAALVPLVRDKVARDGKPTAYVCERHVCKLPTTDVDVFARQIRERRGRNTPAEPAP
jgi:uncharacterized protein YyaL (SSP411 family)